MTTLILDGDIVKEKTDDGKMFYYSAMPDHHDEEYYCGNCGDVCFNIDLPIKDFLNADSVTKCRIKVELDK